MFWYKKRAYFCFYMGTLELQMACCSCAIFLLHLSSRCCLFFLLSVTPYCNYHPVLVKLLWIQRIGTLEFGPVIANSEQWTWTISQNFCCVPGCDVVRTDGKSILFFYLYFMQNLKGTLFLTIFQISPYPYCNSSKYITV